MDDENMAAVAKALAHPARVRIVKLLSEQDHCSGAEVFAGLPLAQSTVSEHLRVLKDAGLVSSHAVGPGMVYCLSGKVLSDFAWAVEVIAASTVSCASNEGGC